MACDPHPYIQRLARLTRQAGELGFDPARLGADPAYAGAVLEALEQADHEEIVVLSVLIRLHLGLLQLPGTGPRSPAARPAAARLH